MKVTYRRQTNEIDPDEFGGGRLEYTKGDKSTWHYNNHPYTAFKNMKMMNDILELGIEFELIKDAEVEKVSVAE